MGISREPQEDDGFTALAQLESQRLRSGRHRSLLAEMAKAKTGNPRNRVKGVASRGRRGRWKWVLIPVLVLLSIPAIQVAVVRFVDPPRTMPMWIDQMSSSGTKAPLRYRWIPLAQIPEMFLKHLWISEDQRFFPRKKASPHAVPSFYSYRVFYVYVLRSESDSGLYIGFSTNLRARLRQHQDGESFATSHRGPWKLIYYEAYLNQEGALGRERYLKSGSGRRFLRTQLRHYLLQEPLARPRRPVA